MRAGKKGDKGGKGDKREQAVRRSLQKLRRSQFWLTDSASVVTQSMTVTLNKEEAVVFSCLKKSNTTANVEHAVRKRPNSKTLVKTMRRSWV